MKIFRWMCVVTMFVALFATAPQISSASTLEPYSQSAFEKAQSEGKVILLDFYASWCPTCRKQHAVLPGVLVDDAFKDLVALQVDYDDSDALQKALKVTSQSTFVLFKGKEEVGRATGLTDAAQIRELLLRAYKQ